MGSDVFRTDYMEHNVDKSSWNRAVATRWAGDRVCADSWRNGVSWVLEVI